MPRPEIRLFQTGHLSSTFPALRPDALRSLAVTSTHSRLQSGGPMEHCSARVAAPYGNCPHFPTFCHSASSSTSLLKPSFLFQGGKRRGEGMLYKHAVSLSHCSLLNLPDFGVYVQDGDALPAKSKICCFHSHRVKTHASWSE